MKEQLEWKERLGWKAQIEMWEVQMKDLLETSRPPATTPAAKRNYETSRDQHSTHVPPIRITKSTRRFIDEGEYRDALCVDASHRWNRQYKRWEAVIEFVFQPPVPDGPPVPMHVRLGDDPVRPELPDHHWLFDLLFKLDPSRIDVAALKGHFFDVTVKTIKKAQNERAERPAKQWYSRVSRMSLSGGFAEMVAHDELENVEPK